MNKLRVVAGIFTLVAASSAAQASDNGIYLGVGAGSAQAKVTKDTTQGLLNDFDGNAGAYKLIAGIRPINWLGAEVNYMDLGKADSGTLATDSNGLAGYAVGFVSVAPIVDVFAKAGVVNWKSKITAGKSALLNRDGTDAAYGAGVSVHFLSLSVRAEYEHFQIDDGANLVSVGVTWTFL